MKVIGTNSGNVIVELTCAEWEALGGAHMFSGYTRLPDTSRVPEIRNMVKALRDIQNARPQLENIRTVMQTFLLLTSPDEIREALKKCGVCEPVVEEVVADAKKDEDDNSEEF